MPGAKPSQRQRLIAAMTETVARYGYGEASVARVLAEAGVSRATFYEQFGNKEDCFLAAYRESAQRVAREMEEVGAARGPAVRTREILARLLENADREPAAARVVLLESLAAGPEVRIEHERFLTAMERAVEAFLDDSSSGGAQLQIPARALMGGLGSVVAMRVFRGETGRLAGLLDDLGGWLRAYAVPAGRRLGKEEWARIGSGLEAPVEPEPSPLDEPLPRLRGSGSPAAVASQQRRRILAAVARVTMEKGYGATTVADIVAVAGTGREAFYKQFRSKEDAFLSTQSFALEASVSRAAGQFFGEGSWPDRVWSAAWAMFGYMARVPELSHLDFVESYAAGGAAIRRSTESRMAYTLFLEEGYRQRPEAEALPRLCSEAIAGAILELLRRHTVEGRSEQMLTVLPQTVYVALAPFVGPEEALRLVEEKAAAARRAGTPSERSPARRPAG